MQRHNERWTHRDNDVEDYAMILFISHVRALVNLHGASTLRHDLNDLLEINISNAERLLNKPLSDFEI